MVLAIVRFPTIALLSVVFACGGSACCAEQPPTYYKAAEGKSGKALRQALHEIIDDHRAIAYTLTDEAFAITDRDPADPSRVTLIYSRRSEPALCCTGEWNREHLWPNALGIDKQLPPYSDLHNLRPSDYDVNSERGHKYFDESDATASGFADPAHQEAPLCSADLDSWEPPESIKGDIARAMFYMAIRYEGGAGEPDLELTDEPAEITTDAAKMGRLTTLLVWHLIDPVNEGERQRNDAVFTQQGNRNPFVDHPEWVAEIWPIPLQIKQALDSVKSRPRPVGTQHRPLLSLLELALDRSDQDLVRLIEAIKQQGHLVGDPARRRLHDLAVSNESLNIKERVEIKKRT